MGMSAKLSENDIVVQTLREDQCAENKEHHRSNKLAGHEEHGLLHVDERVIG
jgi:hypothetical protein